MKDKKGFSLVELLATIVILGLIIVITVPNIMKIFEKSEMESLRVSTKKVSDAAEKYYIQTKIDTKKFDKINMVLNDKKTLELLHLKGEPPKGGLITINAKGEIDLSMHNGKYCAKKNFLSSKIIVLKGSLTCETNYKINSIEDLVKLSKEVSSGDLKLGKTYFLMKNLDFQDNSSYVNYMSKEFGDINADGVIKTIKEEVTTGLGFVAIGLSPTAPFKGNINGLGYSIKNLYINNAKEKQAFISVSEYSTIENLNLSGYVKSGREASLLVNKAKKGSITNVNVEGETKGVKYVALIASEVYSTKIENCFSKGTINAPTSTIVGGMVAKTNDSTLINNCHSDINITADSEIGGIAGRVSENTQIINSYSTGNINSNSHTGGLVGTLNENATVNECHSNVTVTSNNRFGGLVGVLSQNIERVPKVMNSYTNGKVITTGASAGNSGSLVGMNGGKIYNSFSTATLVIQNSPGNNGGLVGLNGTDSSNHANILIDSCYFAGNIEYTGTTDEIGSFLGQNGADSQNAGAKFLTLKNSYSLSNLNAINRIGMIGVGVMNAENLFNGGQIKGTTNVGNIVGLVEGVGATYNNVYSINQNNPITNNMGTSVSRTELNEGFFKNTVKLGKSFKYSDEYYPLLYKRNEDGTIKNELVQGQTKIKFK
ncbi:MAG: prepilin-type N-terminal cleavage/methylation domain-containing protein [Bacilli bacterium]